jgi:hypothetical protein
MDVDDHARAESSLMMLGDGVGVRQDIDASPRVGSFITAHATLTVPPVVNQALSWSIHEDH